MEKIKFEKSLYIATENVAEFMEKSSETNYLEEMYYERWLGGPYDEEMTEMHCSPLNSSRFKAALANQMKMIRDVLTELKKASSKEEVIVNKYLYDYLCMDLAKPCTKKFLIKAASGLYNCNVDYVKDDVFTLTEINHFYHGGCELERLPDFSGQTIKIWSLYEE